MEATSVALRSWNLSIRNGKSGEDFEEKVTRTKVAFWKNPSRGGAEEGLDWGDTRISQEESTGLIRRRW